MKHPDNHDEKEDLKKHSERVKLRRRQHRHAQNGGHGPLKDRVAQMGESFHGFFIRAGLVTCGKAVGHVSGEIDGEADADGENDHGDGIQRDVP